MRVSVLASGSGGNSCVVESAGTRVLVDAGLSGREIERRLRARGIEPDSIAGIFVTHEHNDHSSGALSFSTRWGCPVFATPGTAAALGLEGDLFSPFVPIEPLRDGPYTWFLKKRISGGWGHLSNRQSADAVRAAAGSRLRRVLATHLSRTNNAPALVLAALGEALERAECAAVADVADQILGYDPFDA